jgi:hypothetical protein
MNFPPFVHYWIVRLWRICGGASLALFLKTQEKGDVEFMRYCPLPYCGNFSISIDKLG